MASRIRSSSVRSSPALSIQPTRRRAGQQFALRAALTGIRRPEQEDQLCGRHELADLADKERPRDTVEGVTVLAQTLADESGVVVVAVRDHERKPRAWDRHASAQGAELDDVPLALR